MAQSSLRERLTGAWHLRSFVFTDEAGGKMHPLGDRPGGYLFITPDDHIAFNFTAQERPPFASDDLFAGTEAELAAAARAVVAFGGPFRIDGDAFVIDVRYSLFPNWIGKTQVRCFALDGDTLMLRTLRPMTFGGALRLAEATLNRA
jgi:hypothetical protein